MCDCTEKGNHPDCDSHGVQADPAYWCTCGKPERCLVHDATCHECGSYDISYFDLIHNKACEECQMGYL